jgi:hypothetical protein
MFMHLFVYLSCEYARISWDVEGSQDRGQRMLRQQERKDMGPTQGRH